MNRKGEKGTNQKDRRGKDASDLLNFQFSNPHANNQQQSGGRRRRNDQSHHRNTWNHTSNSRQYRPTKEDRVSARRKASSAMFYLHSSPDHAFVISRRRHGASNACHQQQHVFQGSDSPVPWSSVRVVKYFCSSSSVSPSVEESCPICLDSFRCARITKCGHVFCLACLIHHIQSFTMLNPYKVSGRESDGVRCPCCAIPLHLEDVRPVLFLSVSPPLVNHHVRLVKLHRVKGCPSPFLPICQGGDDITTDADWSIKRSSPFAIPCQNDPDDKFCRFNYVDPHSFRSHLQQNLLEIQHYSTFIQSELSAGNSVYDDIDKLSQTLAHEFVTRELQCAEEEMSEEIELMTRFAQPSSGFYQKHPKHLIACSHNLSENRNLQQKPCSPVLDGNTSKLFDGHEPPDGALCYSKQPENLTQDLGSQRGLSHTLSTETLQYDATDERRQRGDSTASVESYLSRTTSVGRNGGPGSMYLDEDETVFYQADDGTLCFLSGFNMKCLQTEFSSHVPTEDDLSGVPSHSRSIRSTPLPDVVEGRVFEIERVHLTQDYRNRLRFLSHLPLHVDICVVEISLNMLSRETKRRFQKDFAKRKQLRLAKAKEEKRVEERERKKEQARIMELKARLQRIDPGDDFFRPSQQEPVECSFVDEEFGPSVSQRRPDIVGGGAQAPVRSQVYPEDSSLSFSQICRAGGAFPMLGSQDDQFPALGSSPPVQITKPRTSSWSTKTKKSETTPLVESSVPDLTKKKKTKAKKVVLFSTGGHRGIS